MLRPCIDLHGGKVKQIVGSTLTDRENELVENFVSEKNPAYYAQLFKEHNLVGGHVIMLGSGNEAAATEILNAYPGGLQVGGGITLYNAGYYLKQGASHVIITSYIFEEQHFKLDRVKEMVREVGKTRLVIDLSCRRKDGVYYVVTNRWQTFTDFEINLTNIRLLEQYCDEFLVHGVDVEGKKQGIDLELVQLLTEITQIPVTYAGGIHNLEEIQLINEIGRGRIHYTVGSALDIFGGSLKLEDVIRGHQ